MREFKEAKLKKEKRIMKYKIKVRRWWLLLDNGEHFSFDSSKWDVSEDDLARCVQEQVYTKKRGKKIMTKKCENCKKEDVLVEDRDICEKCIDETMKNSTK